MCAWSNSWLDAYAENDPVKMAAATTVIAEFPTWQSIADPRVADDTIRHQIAEVVAGAKAGNAEPVEQLVQAACPSG